MKTFAIGLALVCAIAGGAVAAPVTMDTYAGWNLIALPCVPVTPDVASVFAGGSGMDVMFTAALTRWDSPTQSMVGYDAFNTPGDFGNMLLGEGYWFNYPEAGQISYDALADGVPGTDNVPTDMWISLPGGAGDGKDAGGWNLIGCPYNHEVAVDSGALVGDLIKFTDGTDTKNWDEAAQAGWVDSAMTFWDGASQSMVDMGYFFNTSDRFLPGHGYWLNTKKDNLALILPGA